MIIYSQERLVPTDVNMMVLRSKNNVGFFYIHRSLYDQAVILRDIYEDNYEALVQALTGKTEIREDVKRFVEEMPIPLNMFGPYLTLVTEPLEELVDMVGAIHVMSGPLHLRNMLKVPLELRNTVPQFSLSIKEEYQLAWDRFFMNTLPYTPDMFTRNQVTPMNGVQTTTIPADEISDFAREHEDLMADNEDDALLNLMESGIDFFAMVDADREKEGESADEAATAEGFPTITKPAEPIVEPEPEPEPVAEPEPAKSDNLVARLLSI